MKTQIVLKKCITIYDEIVTILKVFYFQLAKKGILSTIIYLLYIEIVNHYCYDLKYFYFFLITMISNILLFSFIFIQLYSEVEL